METVSIIQTQAKTAEKYQIIIGQGALKEVIGIKKLRKGDLDSIAIIYDKAVESIVIEIVSYLGKCVLIAVESGEKSKQLSEVEGIILRLLENGINRQSLIINVGGGMLTDLGGFVASIYMRGIPFINIPTSLLGMVDAAIGGKTGVDIKAFKNIAGGFYNPLLVIEDIDTLKTLPQKQLNEGLVEVIKIAAMLDKDFFKYLENNMSLILNRDHIALKDCIRNAVKLKAMIVEEDHKDFVRRIFLNFGHTIGHAIETISQFNISHGKAVSIGMVNEMKLIGTFGSIRLVDLLKSIDMPTEIPKEFSLEQIYKIMLSDKKTVSGKIRVSVPQRIGEGIVEEIDKDRFLLLS